MSLSSEFDPSVANATKDVQTVTPGGSRVESQIEGVLRDANE